MAKDKYDLAGALATLRKSDQAELNSLLLEFAAKGNLRAVKTLIESGAALDAKDKYGRTPLHLAAFYGHTATVKALIANGAALDARDNEGWTPCHIAVLYGQTKAADALFAKGAPLDARETAIRTARYLTILNEHTTTAALLQRSSKAHSPTSRIRAALQALQQG
jgi:uncharacterized protein